MWIAIIAALVIGFIAGRMSVRQTPVAEPGRLTAQTPTIDSDLRTRAAQMIRDGRKIDAIGLIREETGMGLAEAETIADQLQQSSGDGQ